jgi:hypothetical protein
LVGPGVAAAGVLCHGRPLASGGGGRRWHSLLLRPMVVVVDRGRAYRRSQPTAMVWCVTLTGAGSGAGWDSTKKSW